MIVRSQETPKLVLESAAQRVVGSSNEVIQSRAGLLWGWESVVTDDEWTKHASARTSVDRDGTRTSCGRDSGERCGLTMMFVM